MTIHDIKLDRSSQAPLREQQEQFESVPAARSSKLRSILAAGVVAVGIVATLAWTGFLGWLAFHLLAG